MWERSHLKRVWPSVDEAQKTPAEKGVKHTLTFLSPTLWSPTSASHWLNPTEPYWCGPYRPASWVQVRVEKGRNGFGGANGKERCVATLWVQGRHKNIFVPQCFLHNFSITNLHLLMGKCIYYILLLESSLGKLSSILSKTWILSTGTMFYFWAIERSQGLMFSSLYAGVLRGPISDTPVSYRTDIGIGQMKNFFKSHLEY